MVLIIKMRHLKNLKIFRSNKLFWLQKAFPSFSSSRGAKRRSNLPIAPPRHCEPKGWQVCWREAISSLLIPVGVRSSGEIASPDCYQARNDAIGLFARNDVVGLQTCNDVTKTLLIALQRS